MRWMLHVWWLALVALTMSAANAFDRTPLAASDVAVEEGGVGGEQMSETSPVERRAPPLARRWEMGEEELDAAALRSGAKDRPRRGDVRSTELFRDARLAPTMLLTEEAAKIASRMETREWNSDVRFGAELHGVRERQSDP